MGLWLLPLNSNFFHANYRFFFQIIGKEYKDHSAANAYHIEEYIQLVDNPARCGRKSNTYYFHKFKIIYIKWEIW
jgi:isocitrate dehydrogenase kinase/phosphatase